MTWNPKAHEEKGIKMEGGLRNPYKCEACGGDLRVCGHRYAVAKAPGGCETSGEMWPIPAAEPAGSRPQSEGHLVSEAGTRKEYPIGTGVVDYFPDALVAVAHVSFVGNKQHNPGQPLHWNRSKSTDEADALMRHFIERGAFDVDGIRHSAKMAWRALALLQKELEAEKLKGGQ